ncbi:MAG: imelysin family protein [Pseudomonadota bacterium]
MTRRRPALLIIGGLLWCTGAQAQRNWAEVAVPVYNPVHAMQGLHKAWTAPRAQEFATAASALSAAMHTHCTRAATAQPSFQAVRQSWREATTAWERLSAVPIGPVIERRSLRQIDFTPTRPALIEKAVATQPQGPAAMQRIGTPAKGLPALEWLLWRQPAASGTPACAYGTEVAREIDTEATALDTAFRALAERPTDAWDDEAAVAGMNEFINQWVGATERLRWAHMEKPLRAGTPKDLPRAASASTVTSWAAQWGAVRSLARFEAEATPRPGEGLVPIETYLRSRGHNALADRWVNAVATADTDMQAATPTSRSKVLAAAKSLAALKRLAEDEVAPALDVRIGFSDADGD